MADVLKENAKLAQLVAQKTKIIELSGVEINKLRVALHTTHQQNLHLAQAHSQITAELNQAKDRLKVLQHELACATAVLKVKASGIERKSSTADNQLQTKITSQEDLKAASSKFPPIEAHQADNKGTSANVHHSVETRSSVPFNTDQPEAPPDKTSKRTSVNTRTSKRKSESCEGTKETNTFQQSHIPDVQPTGSSHHEDQRNTARRRSSRLNPGSCEMAEASCEILHTDTSVPSSCSFSVPELDEPYSGEDMQKAAQDELLCNTAVHIKASVLKKDEINKHLQKEANVQEIQEAHSGVNRIEDPEAHQIDNQATNTIPIHPAETQPSLPFNAQQPEPPKERAKKRGGHKRKLDSRGGQKDSNIEDTNAKLDSTCSEPPYHEETRKSPRRKSSRKNPGESGEATKVTLETKQEEIIAPIVPSSSDVVMEQSKDEKQSDSRSSMEPSEEQAAGRSLVQVTGRRSSMRAAAKAVCYKEIPVNVKMRRP